MLIPRKLVETAFRLWWVILIPLVLLPALVVAATREPATYVSFSTVWITKVDGVEPGTLSRTTNPYLSPAQNQALVIGDLLITRSFLADIAERADLVGASATQADKEFIGSTIRGQIRVGALGPNLVGIWTSAPSGEAAQKLGAAVIAEFEERASDELVREVDVLRAYYSGQLGPAMEVLDQANAALAVYVSANPSVAEPGRTDPEYTRLAAEVVAQQQRVNSINGAVQDLDLREASGDQGQQAVFNVVDQPSFPTAPAATSFTTRIGYPIAGVMLACLIGFGVIYIVYRTDHSIRSHQDLVGVEVPLLGYVPALRPGLTPSFRRRDYARQVAASIARHPAEATGGNS